MLEETLELTKIMTKVKVYITITLSVIHRNWRRGLGAIAPSPNVLARGLILQPICDNYYYKILPEQLELVEHVHMLHRWLAKGIFTMSSDHMHADLLTRYNVQDVMHVFDDY